MITYVTYYYRLTPWFIERKHLLFDAACIVLQERICMHNSLEGGMEQDCTQFAVLILCHDSTGCDEMRDYFAIETDTLIDIVRLTWIMIVLEYL